jgi:hypothetical protein
MANRGKRISELTALESASLQTTLVGVDNGTTYKVTLDVLEDAIINMVYRSTDLRLDSLEAYTSSVTASSIPIGTISSSTQITSLGFLSTSVDLTSLNQFTSSQSTLNTAFTNGINARLQTSSFNDFSESINGRVDSLESWSSSLTDTFATDLEVSIVSSSVAATIGIISQNTGLVSTSSFNSFTESIDSRVDSLENVTSSFLTSLDGAISSSSQLTSSLDSRYLQSGSSSSSDSITFNRTAGINVTEGQMAWNNSDGTLDIGLNFGDVVLQVGQEQHFVVRNETGTTISNGTAVYASGLSAGSKRIEVSPFTANGTTDEVRFLGLATHNISDGVNGVVSNFGYVRGLDTRGTSATAISVGDETWAEGDILYAHPTAAGKLTKVAPKDKITVAMVTTRHQTTGVLFVRPSSFGHIDDLHDVQITTGSLVTGSMLVWNGDYFVNNDTFSASVDNRLDTLESSTGSYLTSSFDTRYVISGSVGATPLGTISGSAQITAFGFISSSQTIDTASLATTGSNSFNGNQTITGSLVVSTVAVVNGGITVPTGSVITLTTGSSISVDSSGAITGSLTGSVFGIGDVVAFSSSVNSRIISGSVVAGTISGSSQLTSSFDTRYAISASFVSSSNLSSIRTITSASYAALTPVSGTLYIIIG